MHARPLTFYLGTPGNQMQAHAANGMPVLVSYAARKAWLDDYARGWSRLLLDSGAYSELNSGAVVDVGAYFEWAAQYPWVDAVAGLDDIRGDWRRSLTNYERGGFPTFHDTDPDALLDDLIPMARERGNWLGIGLLPPRVKREDWLRRTLDRIPPDLHVHGWALGAYSYLERLDSVDSTNWWRDSHAILVNPLTRHLTPGEALDVVVKRYRRCRRVALLGDDSQGVLWGAP